MKNRLTRALFRESGLALGPPILPAEISVTSLREHVAALRGNRK
jgi:hypothetical protein